jgi:hypothetical protein
MAQPWGSNYAYQDFFGYLLLAVFIAFDLSPNIGLAFLSLRFKRSIAAFVCFAVGASVISLGGAFAYFDVAFINIDAQGGLVFLFMPIVQWLAILLLLGVCALIALFRPSPSTPPALDQRVVTAEMVDDGSGQEMEEHEDSDRR